MDCLDDQQVEKLRVSWAFKTRTRFDDRETKKQAGAWQMALVLLDLFFKFFEHQEDGGYVFQTKRCVKSGEGKSWKFISTHDLEEGVLPFFCVNGSPQHPQSSSQR